MKSKLFSKTLALLLLAVMLVVSVTACGNAPVTTTTTKGEEIINPLEKLPPQLEGMEEKTKDSTVSFIFVDGSSGSYTADSIWVDPESGDLDDVDSGIVERNNRIYQNFGITIEPNHVTSVGIDGLQGYTKQMFDTQDDTIDVYCGYQYFDISLATQGHLYNLHDIVNDNDEEIIDITQSYWATNYINSITYNDYMYWVTGDLSLRYSGGLYCTFVNTELYDNFVKGSYENKSIYEIVNEGNWNMQTMLDMIELGAQDADGDGKIVSGEIAGFVYQQNDIWDGLAFGCKVEFGKKVRNANGTDEVTIALGDDTKAKSFALFCDQLYSSNNTLGVDGTDSVAQMEAFNNGEALFVVNQLYQSPIFLSEMESFAIIPTPKLNDSQTAYASGCHDSLTIYGISRYTDVPVASAVALELMSFYGSELVAPVFYEKYILGGRTVREDESIAMIEKIREGFDSDFVAAWSNSLSNIVHTFRNPSNCKGFTNYTKYMANRWPTGLRTLISKLEEAAEAE